MYRRVGFDIRTLARFARPKSGRIPFLPPYSPQIAEAAALMDPQVIPGCPARGIRDVTEPYEQRIEESGPRSIWGRNFEKVSGE